MARRTHFKPRPSAVTRRSDPCSASRPRGWRGTTSNTLSQLGKRTNSGRLPQPGIRESGKLMNNSGHAQAGRASTAQVGSGLAGELGEGRPRPADRQNGHGEPTRPGLLVPAPRWRRTNGGAGSCRAGLRGRRGRRGSS
jgi:hypothetical protein